VENVSSERVSPGVYRLEFEAHNAGRIQVFSDDSPDRITASKPVAVVKTSPADIRVPELKGRVYFHLKPEHGNLRTVSTRQLPLEGAANFRDLGGYRTSNGKSIRWGKVYRSNNLAGLTDADYKFLESIHLKLVCDVRTEYERNQQPTKWQGTPPQFLLAPIGSETMIREASASFDPKSAAASQSALVSETRGYEQFIAEFAGQYDLVFHRLAAGEVPLMFHCSAGRDRTGTFAALLLTMLGVPRQTVVEDYVLTGKYLLADTNIEKMASDLQKSMGLSSKPDIASLRTRLEMKPAVIESTFRVIDERYGSFDAYRRDQLHITDAQMDIIRKLLLEE
jgi:protein-tyrosine phosphatase